MDFAERMAQELELRRQGADAAADAATAAQRQLELAEADLANILVDYAAPAAEALLDGGVAAHPLAIARKTRRWDRLDGQGWPMRLADIVLTTSGELYVGGSKNPNTAGGGLTRRPVTPQGVHHGFGRAREDPFVSLGRGGLEPGEVLVEVSHQLAAKQLTYVAATGDKGPVHTGGYADAKHFQDPEQAELCVVYDYSQEYRCTPLRSIIFDLWQTSSSQLR